MTGLKEVPQRADDPIRDLERFIRARVHRQAAGDVGELDFFRDMLRSLKKIASGNGTPEDQERLKEGLAATERGVNEIMERLRAAREMLAGRSGSDEFTHRIDDVVDGSFAKIGVRERVGEVIATGLPRSHPAAQAQALCSEIDTFNRAVIDLGRRARNWSNEAKPRAPNEILGDYLSCSLEDLYKIVGAHADRSLTGADRERYVLGVPDELERGKQIVDAYRRKICERQTRFDLEVSAELRGGHVLEPIAWLQTVAGYILEFRTLDGLTIDAVDAVVMALGRVCDWDLYKLRND